MFAINVAYLLLMIAISTPEIAKCISGTYSTDMHIRIAVERSVDMELVGTLIVDQSSGCAAIPLPDARDTHVLDLAWTAGFVDGEGCIHMSKTRIAGRKNFSYRLVMSITQNHLGSLTRVARTLDLPHYVYEVRRSVGMNRDAYTLIICDQHVVSALRLLLPYLTRKAPEARVAIEAYQVGKMNIHPGPKGHAPEVWTTREKSYRKLRAMK